MYIPEHEVPMMEYYDFWMHKVLRLYIPPILLVIGTIGNVLSFCVLIRRSMRKTSTYNYLATLAVTDMLILYVGLLRLWIGEMTGWDIRDEANWSCKVISMAGYTVSVCSVWLLIAVTVERYIVTVHSLHAATMCTRSRAVKVILCILGAIFSTNLHFLWTTELGVFVLDDQNVTMCASSEGAEYLVDQVWPWVDAFFYCFSPFVIICILNGLIVHKVILSRKQRNLMSANSVNCSSRGGSSSNHSSGESSIRVTVMLLSISFTFIICTLPMNAVMIKSAFVSPDTATLEEISQYSLARTVSELLMYTNHSVNFYLYLLTGQKFRQQLMQMLCVCGCCRNSSGIGGSGNNTSSTGSTSLANNHKAAAQKQQQQHLQQQHAGKALLTDDTSV